MTRIGYSLVGLDMMLGVGAPFSNKGGFFYFYGAPWPRAGGGG